MLAPSPSFRPGDLIGFSSPDFLGAMINLATWGIPGWGLSHVAILAEFQPHGLLLCESTTQAAQPCTLRRLHTSGVQAHDIDGRLDGFAGRAWHYPVIRTTTSRQEALLTRYLRESLGANYDALGAMRARSTALGLLERLLCNRPENLESLFCSELVAAAWRWSRIWPRSECGHADRWNPNALARAALRLGVTRRPRRIK